MNAAIVVVGDEILSGHVRDANGHFIAQRLAAHGHRLSRISIVGDDPDDIAAAVRVEASIGDIVLVCGGVGPTHDDRTMEGVAAAAGVPLAVCEPIRERIDSLARRVSEAVGGDPLGIADLQKMALVPEGAECLPSTVGLIPAVVLRLGRGWVVVLPGPPRELQAVFRDAVEPRFLDGTGETVFREEIEHPFPESAVARMLTDFEAETPEVKIGSYPMEAYSLVRVTGPEHAVRAVAERVREGLRSLEASDEGRDLLRFLEQRRGG